MNDGVQATINYIRIVDTINSFVGDLYLWLFDEPECRYLFSYVRALYAMISIPFLEWFYPSSTNGIHLVSLVFPLTCT